MANNNRAINRVFTHKVINDLIVNGKSATFDYVVRRYINDPEKKNHGELISEIYTCLEKQQRNEYYYTNTLLNKLLCGIHSVNSTTALSQLRIEHSIADFVMINGEGRVYEIKSDLDNFERLHSQLLDYYCAFSKVSVLASEREQDKVKSVLSSFGEMGDSVGIYVLSNRNTIFNKDKSREPIVCNKYLKHSSIFKLLRKYEYENVINEYFGSVPQTKPVFHFRDCLEKFEKIPITNAQSLAFNELKKRNKITTQEFERIQPELKSVIYFSSLVNKMPEINHLMETQYRG